MTTSKNNPGSNVLPSGISNTQIAEAIAKSGYPLQTVVASKLKSGFDIQEEWSYIDEDSGELRTLDVYAERQLFSSRARPPRVRPRLAILGECKRSDLPYVFFKSHGGFPHGEFPLVAGLKEPLIRLESQPNKGSLFLSAVSCLDLNSHPYLSVEPVSTWTLSRVVRQGKSIQLSGSEPYANVVLPLVKAIKYSSKLYSPLSTYKVCNCYLIIAVCFLDAPMIAVEVSKDAPTTTLAPWVRLFRREAIGKRAVLKDSSLYAVDFVHKDFIETYLEKWLLPFSKEFGKRALKHGRVLAECQGFVPNMWTNGLTSLSSTLRPRHSKERGSGSAESRAPETLRH